jgi:preprotein translocase subunit SecE
MKPTAANTIANALLVITMIAIVSLIFAATQI